MKTVKLTYSVGDTVYIKDLKLKGRIIGIFINSGGIEYQTRYFPKSEPSTCYFIEEELTTEEVKGIGFKE